MFWLIIVICVLLLLWLFLIFPGRSSAAARAPFQGRAFAHRGLYSPDQSVPENSLPAFRRAVEAGYGAELDVQLTRDGHVVVFHDDDLARGTGLNGRICDLTLDQVHQLRLFGTDERIPLFADVLAVFAGKQPLIVELKSAPNASALCDAVYRMLAEYNGPACVESFDPKIVRWFRVHDPRRLRGQLAMAFCFYKAPTPAWLAFLLSRLLTGFLARPQFIAYGLGPKCLSARFCESLGAMKVCWTSREAEQHSRLMAENDAVIFEAYRP